MQRSAGVSLHQDPILSLNVYIVAFVHISKIKSRELYFVFFFLFLRLACFSQVVYVGMEEKVVVRLNLFRWLREGENEEGNKMPSQNQNESRRKED